MIEEFEAYITPFELKRKVWVYLPEEYNNSKENYPVLYMYDGHNLFYDSYATFGKSWGLKEFMDAYPKKMIIVGVDCNHLGDNRLLEYFPYQMKPHHLFHDYMQGRGNTYMDWLTQELKPYIDQNYRTLKGRENTMIAGSSMGGLMSLYSIIKYNAIFGYAACLSSTILLCEPELLKEIEEAKLNPKTKIYLDYGGKEWQVRTAKRMHEDIVAALKEKKVEAMFFYDPKAEHCEKDWEKRIPIFMNFWFNI